jgi:hypothetical protein
MGRVHAATHSALIGDENANDLMVKFENRAMRDVQVHAHVLLHVAKLVLWFLLLNKQGAVTIQK